MFSTCFIYISAFEISLLPSISLNVLKQINQEDVSFFFCLHLFKTLQAMAHKPKSGVAE